MDKYERVIAIIAFLLFLLILCTPLFSLSPNDFTESTKNYIFFISEFSFLKSFIMIEGSLIIVLLWLFHNDFKTFVVEHLGFQGNDYLFTTVILAIATGSILSLGEVIKVLGNYTTVLSPTVFYYSVQILLIIELAACVYMLLYRSHNRFKGHVVGYHGKRDQRDVQSDGSLFDAIKHQE